MILPIVLLLMFSVICWGIWETPTSLSRYAVWLQVDAELGKEVEQKFNDMKQKT